ncbi:GA module-containing protein, partial [Staphylococcus aureus]|uniref:GA module-containing protein n=1 Tax=Staphylococcus aureus TaxID=1280 RepID=UPI00119E6483
YNQPLTPPNNIINQTTSPTINPHHLNPPTTQLNNTKLPLHPHQNLLPPNQQANNTLHQLHHLNNPQNQHLQSQITQSSHIAPLNAHKQTPQSLNTPIANLINPIP